MYSIAKSPKRRGLTARAVRLLRTREEMKNRRIRERARRARPRKQVQARKVSRLSPRYSSKNLVFLRFAFVKENRIKRRFYRYMRFLIWMNKYLKRYYYRYICRRILFLGKIRRKRVPILVPKKSYGHGFHLVNASPWPFLLSFSLFGVMLNLGMYFHKIPLSYSLFLFAFMNLGVFLYCWFRDIIVEGTYEGQHTKLVQRGLKLGMILFILSEIMLFFAFFWGFFHSSLAPAIQIGGIWPPVEIEPFDPWDVPLLNTLILLTSGVTVTWAHYAVGTKLRRTLPRNTIVDNMKLNSYFEALLKKASGLLGFPRNIKKLASLSYYRAFKPKIRSKYKHLYPILHDKGKKRFIVEQRFLPHTLTDIFKYQETGFGKKFVSKVDLLQLGISDYFFRRRFCENLDDAFFELYFLFRLKKNLKFFFSEFEYMDARVFYDAWLHEYTLDFIKYDSILSLIWYRLKQLRVPYMLQYVIFCTNSVLETVFALFSTICLGLLFTGLQLCEYINAPFTIADSVYGSTFFLTTGFHGLHVLVGTLFLFVCYKRLLLGHFTKTHHVGFECAIWYWHFVDVVWLGVYLSIYHWGGSF